MLKNRPIKPKRAFQKLKVVQNNIKNWHIIFLDKLFATSNIFYHFKNGVVVECRPKSTDINEAVVVLSGIEYPEELCCFDKDNAVVVDIGANIGTFSLYINHLNPKRNINIFAIEASPENIALCKKNFQHNHINDYVLVQKAITGQNGVVTFDISGNFDGFKVNNSANNGIQVESQKLSTFCQEHNIQTIDLLKMDIEGSEFDIFHVDNEFIKNNVSILFMEYHLSEKHTSIDEIVNTLSDKFNVVLENIHKSGGMLIAWRKAV